MAIADFAAKGFAKYSAKTATMKASYQAAVGRAQANFAAAGFGPTRTSAYQRALTSYAPQDYNPSAAWADKWRTNWTAKMQE